MSEIRQVRCRPKQFQRDAATVVLETGKPLPDVYQFGRTPGVSVKKMSGRDPIICALDDGDTIYLDGAIVLEVVEDE